MDVEQQSEIKTASSLQQHLNYTPTKRIHSFFPNFILGSYFINYAQSVNIISKQLYTICILSELICDQCWHNESE